METNPEKVPDKVKKAWDEWNKNNEPPTLTAEQTIQWLEGMRALMFEIWRCNPGFREKWIEINHPEWLEQEKFFSAP